MNIVCVHTSFIIYVFIGTLHLFLLSWFFTIVTRDSKINRRSYCDITTANIIPANVITAIVIIAIVVNIITAADAVITKHKYQHCFISSLKWCWCQWWLRAHRQSKILPATSLPVSVFSTSTSKYVRRPVSSALSTTISYSTINTTIISHFIGTRNTSCKGEELFAEKFCCQARTWVIYCRGKKSKQCKRSARERPAWSNGNRIHQDIGISALPPGARRRQAS